MCYRHADIIIECPVCGQANEASRITCASCGAVLPDPEDCPCDGAPNERSDDEEKS